MNELNIIAALGTMVLLGAAFLWTALADRRRGSLQQRLKAVVTITRSADEPVATLTLGRRLSRAGPGSFYSLPAAFWERLDSEFAAAGNRIGLPHLVVAACVAAIIVFGLVSRVLALNLGFAVLLGGAAALAAAIALLRLAQSRYRNRFLDVFPNALDLICRAVTAGLAVTEAMAVAAREIADPVGRELRQVLDEVRIGVEPHDALERAANRTRVADFRFFAVAIKLQKRTGGSLAETLANLSAVIRARKMLRLKARALSAETKASAFVLALLPFVVGGLMYVINRNLMSVLFSDPRGQMMLGFASLSLLAGIAVMAVLIKRSVR